MALTSLVFAIVLGFDWIQYLTKPSARRGFVEKRHPDDGPRRSFSTRSLNWQTVLLSVLTVWLMGVLIPSTILSRNGSGILMVGGGTLPGNMSIDTRYWDYGFCRWNLIFPYIQMLSIFYSEMRGSRPMV